MRYPPHTLAARRRALLVAFLTTTTNALALRNAAKRIMRAAVYDPAAPQGARLVERAAPKPVKRCCRGVVLCEVRSCGANPVDAKYVIGDKFPESWLPWASRRVAGSTPGFDFSGVVIQAPAGSGFAAGDEVFGFAEDPSSLRPWRSLHGSFCEVVNAPLDQVAHKPSKLSWQEAAAAPLVCITALQALEQHGVSAGQRVLVIGASGGVGHVAVQIAKCLGADVVGVCACVEINQRVGCTALTRPCWLHRAVRSRQRHAIEQHRVDGVEDDATMQCEGT